MVSNFGRNAQNSAALNDREYDNGTEPRDAKRSPRRRETTTPIDDDVGENRERADDDDAPWRRRRL